MHVVIVLSYGLYRLLLLSGNTKSAAFWQHAFAGKGCNVMWRLHINKIMLTIPLLTSGLLLAIWLGTPKATSYVDALDILGEGVVLLVAILWLTLIITSRPAGRVTEWLYYGSLLLVCSFFLDLLDEFFRYPEHIRVMSWLESLPAPIGMLALTYGLIGWHREQRIINRQLQGRELLLRDHRLLDPLTQLYGVDYLYAVLARDLALQRTEQQPLSLIMLNIQQFSRFNRQQGMAAGDEFLMALAAHFSAQLRISDVLCRYAGDRFVAVLTNTPQQQADIMAQHLQLQFAQFSKTLQLDIVAHEVSGLNPQQALDSIEAKLHANKAAPQHAAVVCA